MIAGELSVLNAGAGDLRFKFDAEDPKETERARSVVTDLLRQGYLIVVEDERGWHHVVREFDPATSEYIVTGHGSPPRDERPEPEPAAPEPAEKKRRGRKRRISATTTGGVAVAPSAGG